MISNETEHPSDPESVALRKHRKNLNVLSLSQVCKTWRFRMINNVVLWRDIAFDISDVRSVEVARLFLKAIEVLEDIRFCVYAGFGTSVDSGITDLLARLRPLTNRIMRFQYTGKVEGYLQHLDLPAPNLCHFVGRIDPILFSGQTNALRSL